MHHRLSPKWPPAATAKDTQECWRPQNMCECSVHVWMRE